MIMGAYSNMNGLPITANQAFPPEYIYLSFLVMIVKDQVIMHS